MLQDIPIVAPYNVQVAAIASRLPDGWPAGRGERRPLRPVVDEDSYGRGPGHEAILDRDTLVYHSPQIVRHEHDERVGAAQLQ
jgi:hypothetical protein